MEPHEAISSLDYFVGKVCTIHTRPTNWKHLPEENLDYFMGLVNSIGEVGVCLTNVINHTKTFIFTKDMIAISEETVFNADDPGYAQAIKDYEEKKTKLIKNNPKLATGEPKKVPLPIPPPPQPIAPAENTVNLTELYDIAGLK